MIVIIAGRFANLSWSNKTDSDEFILRLVVGAEDWGIAHQFLGHWKRQVRSAILADE